MVPLVITNGSRNIKAGFAGHFYFVFVLPTKLFSNYGWSANSKFCRVLIVCAFWILGDDAPRVAWEINLKSFILKLTF